VPVDPAPFLSTVILASAALVAIVGGLLVARFVGLDSDQQTSRKLLSDASERLTIARRRAEAATQNLLRWRAADFLDEEGVAGAIASGQTDIGELRKLGRTRLTDDELRRVLSQAAEDVTALQTWLSADTVRERIRRAEYQWSNFSRDDIPALHYPRLAGPIFTRFAQKLASGDEEKRRREEKIRRDEEERQRRATTSVSPMLGLGTNFRFADSFAGMNLFEPPDYSALTKGLIVRPPNAMLIEANRHDDLVAAVVRGGQRVEDLEEELRRLRQQHADVIKPDARMWWAVAILTAYAIAGVALPLWVMSNGPVSLSAVRWTFWPFAGGLAVLIGYIAWYLLGLTRRRRQWALIDSAD
jgi:hypothetical protein